MKQTTALTKQQRAELSDLQAVAARLESLSQPERSAAARRAGLARVRAARPTPERRVWLGLAFAPAAGFALLLILVFVAQSALPGQKLYALKRSTETAQDALAFSPEHKAGNCSKLMKRRANELTQLASSKPSDAHVNDLTRDILQETNEFQEYVRKAPASSQPAMTELRKHDASLVANQLGTIKNAPLSTDDAKRIDQTISTLHDIAG